MLLYSLVRPFDQIAPLRNRVGTLVTIIMRLANLVAKADGTVSRNEANNLRALQQELETSLIRIPIDESGHHQEARQAGLKAVEQSRLETSTLRAEVGSIGSLGDEPSPGGTAARSGETADRSQGTTG